MLFYTTMSEVVDITGQKFNRLLVIKRVENNEHGESRWLCRCTCGKEKIVVGRYLKSNHTQSCGCLHKELGAKRIYKFSKKYNTYDLSGKYGIGYTTKGYPFYFDLEDYDKIKDVCWHLTKLKYIGGHFQGKLVLLHAFILGKKSKMVIDHINHNTADNRKENLRICSHRQNRMNHKIYKNNTTGYSGVRFCKASNKWTAHISVNYKTINLGTFESMEEAVDVRKKAEKKYFDKFAYKGNFE